jgi:predicted RNA-binding protein
MKAMKNSMAIILVFALILALFLPGCSGENEANGSKSTNVAVKKTSSEDEKLRAQYEAGELTIEKVLGIENSGDKVSMSEAGMILGTQHIEGKITDVELQEKTKLLAFINSMDAEKQ